MAHVAGYTTLNPWLNTDEAKEHGDAWRITAGNSSEIENLMEYAARLCYHSTNRMGTHQDGTQGFLRSLQERGHLDVIEHGRITVRLDGLSNNDVLNALLINRYLRADLMNEKNGEWMFTANARAWQDVLYDFVIDDDAYDAMGSLIPSILDPISTVHTVSTSFPAVEPVMLPSGARVTLLAAAIPHRERRYQGHGSATFLFEGISRACSHQLVRHRRFSFSQESQRYVDQERSGGEYVLPPHLDDSKKGAMVAGWKDMSKLYRILRNHDVRKEDARFVLPAMAATRIVVSGDFEAWQHFFDLRALDPAAQWEIRTIAQAALKQLAWAAPLVFAEQASTLEEEEHERSGMEAGRTQAGPHGRNGTHRPQGRRD